MSVHGIQKQGGPPVSVNPFMELLARNKRQAEIPKHCSTFISIIGDYNLTKQKSYLHHDR